MVQAKHFLKIWAMLKALVSLLYVASKLSIYPQSKLDPQGKGQ